MSGMKRYIAYLRDNPHGYWFRRKLYGWGWVPARWQGWVIILAFIGYAAWLAVRVNQAAMIAPYDEAAITLWPLSRLAIGIVVIIALCYWKGEPPRWQWGFPKEK